MALFDIFNRKKNQEQNAQPQAQNTQPAAEQEAQQPVDQPTELQVEPQQPASEEEPQQPASEEEPKKKGFFRSLFTREKKETLDQGLEKTKQGVFAKIAHAVAGKSTIDDDVLDNL